MHRLIVLLALVALLAGCGASAPPLTAQQVIDKFKAAGLTADNPKHDPHTPGSPVPQSFTEQMSFTIPEVDPRGGQLFICDTKKNCDALYAYFDAMKAFAGPYLYQSPSGLVVAQLNDGLKPDTAAKYEAVIKALP